MAWGEVNVQEQRVRFVVRMQGGEKSLAALCREFQISRPTGYSWLKRYQAGGISQVVERSRRPKHCPGQTSWAVEEAVVAARQARPDWGARKLQVVLQEQGLRLSVITIHRILLRRDLVREQDRHPAALQRFQREQPNQLWQMDFKGPSGWDSPVGPLAVLDDHSRYALALRQTGSTRAEGVRGQLEEVFQQAGVPEAMLMDHGTPWWNAQAASGWSGLTVWLMKQGVRLYFSAYRHPQTQGKVERFNGTLGAAIKRRGLPPAPQRQAWLDAFRNEYNHQRPHEALEMRVPASCWHASARRYQEQPDPWSYPAGAELRQVSVGGQITLARRQWPISGALQGESVELVRIDQRVLVYYCNTLVRELDLDSGRSLAVAGLSKAPSVIIPATLGDRPECKGCPDNDV